jgi:hypothetical protein
VAACRGHFAPFSRQYPPQLCHIMYPQLPVIHMLQCPFMSSINMTCQMPNDRCGTTHTRTHP